MTKRQRQFIERWENVLRVLQALTPHQRRRHWDMSEYGYKNECGTVACAAGHCGLDPWFRRRGMSMPEEGPFNNWLFAERVETFFGFTGTEAIFFNSEPRPVGQVIREVKAHIKYLRAGGAP